MAVRGDDVAMVALVETTSVGSAIVLVIDTDEPVGNYDWHYDYDDLGRMTFACSDWWFGVCRGNQWQYQYDGAGNLLLFDHWDAEARETVRAQYVINGANQIECIDTDGSGTCGSGEFLWVYDAYGQMLNDGETVYEYDTAGRLWKTTFDSKETTYIYDGDGERVSQTHTDAGTTTYLLDVAASAMLSETNNGKTLHYLNGLNTIAQSDSAGTTYLQYDGTGSMRQLTTPSGEVQYSQTFDPAGNLYKQTEGDTSTIGFAGGTHDTNGLVYSGGRYYRPTQGRFVQQALDRLNRAFSQFTAKQWANTPTWGEFEQGVIQYGRGLKSHSKQTGLHWSTQFLVEAAFINGQVIWEGPFVQNTIRQGQICFSPNTTYGQRFDAFRNLVLDTVWPIVDFGLLMYSPVAFMFPTTTADVMMTSSADDIIRIAQAQQYAEDAAKFARLRAMQAEMAAITGRYLPNGLTIIGDGSAHNARLVDAEAALWQYERLPLIEEVRYSASGSSHEGGIIQLGSTVVPEPLRLYSPYGEGLSFYARQYRYDTGLLGDLGHNVAVFEMQGEIPAGFFPQPAKYGDISIYDDNIFVFSNVSNTIHSEQLGYTVFTEGGIDTLTQVRAVYTEFEPCKQRCLRLLQDPWSFNSTIEITYHFPYNYPNRDIGKILKEDVFRGIFGQ